MLLISVFTAANSILFAQPQGNLDAEFPTEYEIYLPGYKNITVEMLEGGEDSSVSDQIEDEAGNVGSWFDSVKKIFSDRTVLNILVLILAFVAFLIYRLRYYKVRR
ncbi:MAG: hypothetical protein OEZ34_12585 [Spirochaetia bacterium]|nr:hypothetical protein [Spirochaetia bacterium]